MAGAGFKTFNTGDVLTASDVNTYLMQQTVMVFADSSARTTALGANVAEGMISYLKDTNAVEVYNGSNWVSSDDPNAIQNTIVDAKGDIITATAADTPARLAVGSDGQTLVADSSQTTGLAWTSNFAAGKNKVINGDFGIWQRGTSFSLTGATIFTADRWAAYGVTGDSVSQQTFTLGTAPVSGYEGQFFARFTCGSTASSRFFYSKLEDVRTFAGQTVTMSFWAKTASGTATLTSTIGNQNFGSGGSAFVNGTGQNNSVTTTWTRFTQTATIASIAGKTIGTGSFLEAAFSTSNTSVSIDIWGVQLEAGSVATAFQTATGTIQGELAACQRYYFRVSPASAATWGVGAAANTTTAYVGIHFPVTMRITPTALEQSGTAGDYSLGYSTTDATCTAVPAYFNGNQNFMFTTFTVGAVLTANWAVRARAATGNAYLAWSAEL